jgi:hypothetical protein
VSHLGVNRLGVDWVAFLPELVCLWFIRVRDRYVPEVRVIVAWLPIEVQLIARDAVCYQFTVDAEHWFSPVLPCAESSVSSHSVSLVWVTAVLVVPCR